MEPRRMDVFPMDLHEFSHIARRPGPAVQRRIDALKTGQRMQDLPEELWHDSFRYYVKEDPSRQGGPNLRIIRLAADQPTLTVTGYIFNKFVHPVENRYITPREAARLQGFPDEFLFCGPLTNVQRQVGNAVPVPLARAAAQSVLETICRHPPTGSGAPGYRNGELPAVSLFSGAGAMDLGTMQARSGQFSFDIRACVELDRHCCATLQCNFPGTRVINGDAANLAPRELLRFAEVSDGYLPLLIGGPPCQAFSQAGKQRGATDPRGGLIFEFLRFVSALRPLYFIMENVANLRGIANGQLLANIEQEMAQIGYNVSRGLLCAADYGAPQLRRRLIFLGARRPLAAPPLPPPTHGAGLRPYVTAGEAFAGLPSAG